MIDHVASFVGFVPASRPALVILASLDTTELRAIRNTGTRYDCGIPAGFLEATLDPVYASASSRAELDAWFEASFAEALPEVIAVFESIRSILNTFSGSPTSRKSF